VGYSIEFRPSARKALGALPVSDRRRISRAIEKLALDPYTPGSRKLESTEFRRVRAGDYRVVYSIFESKLVVLVIKIGHRREFYRSPPPS
jgi:mRNA interferase RelE/StbE